MEVTALCFRLLMLEFTLLNSYAQKSDAAFLRITPDRLQHFKSDAVTFDCEGSDGSTKLRVIRNNVESDPVCDKRTPSGSSCTIERAYQEDSGEYWCEAEGGERSNSVNISVITAGSVILESPALPVMEGDNVTLSCRDKTVSTNPSADFYKDGVLIRSSSTGEMTIHSVSKSDEGLYKCHISGAGGSPESWMAVRVSSKKRTAASHAVKDNQTLCRDNASDDSDDADDVMYTVVSIKPREDKDAADAADNLSLRSNHTRKPRAEKYKDESSFQSVYSTLTISQTPKALQQESGLSSSTVSLSPTAAKDPSTTEQKPIETTVQKVKSRDA
ncbi:carcinoembryonic antigen-related cell adhesion molecule 20-like [Epinephelus moara]|uniref:carcinoembryonic antigen-related cell adhesion molecule 20-like n=1 Tax=Epinephelus moara TaxID=300413 RepID=UPI00214F37C6|nr:carcinoembryonic antigen-related cell adhesion molecule 20-like [Epinephelus moara]